MNANAMPVQRRPFLRLLLNRVQRHYLAILVIVFVAILAYGILLPSLGFYFDDWIILYLGNMRGASGFIAGFMEDRPAAAAVYILLFDLFRNNLLLWHLYAFTVRLCTALVLYWGVNRLWPRRYLLNTVFVLAFLVYPGLLIQQPALMYINYQGSLCLSIVSLVLTIHAVTAPGRSRQIIFTIISAVLALLANAILEEFIVFEIIRVLVLFYIAYRQRQNNRLLAIFRSTLLWYLPYIPLTTGFLVWRILLFKGSRTVTNVAANLSVYRTNPLRSLFRLPTLMAFDAFEMAVLGWFAPAYDRISSASGESQTLYYAILAIVLVILLPLLHRLDQSSEDDPSSVSLQILILGIFMLLGGLSLITLVGSNVYLLDETTRFATTSLLGVALIMGSFVMLTTKKAGRIVVVAGLIAVGAATQFADGDAYRLAWDRQKAMWSQIQTRIPALKPGTVLIVDYPLSSLRPREDSRAYYMRENYEIWGPLKMVYGDQVGGRLLTDTLYKDVESGITIHETVRSVELNDDLRQVVAVYMPEDGSCLRVLDNRRLEFPQVVTASSRTIAPFSNTNWILPVAPSGTTAKVEFLEPTQTDWCYYFERADLARQTGDWKTVLSLWSEANTKNLQPHDLTEYYPFIESFIHLGRFDQAVPLMERVITNYPGAMADFGHMIGRIATKIAF